MRLVIAGSRSLLVRPEYIEMSIIALGLDVEEIDEVVSGGAQGVDWAGEEFSIEYLNKEAKVFHADWSIGVAAGPIRNRRMAEYGDALLLIWDGKSSGSANMRQEMMKVKKPVYEVVLKTYG